MSNELRRNMALFPIGIVMKLTDLTARQIRYYEQHELVIPARTDGNQRLFSFNDVERLLEIKSLIEKGVNIAGIKQVLHPANRDASEANIYQEQHDAKRDDLNSTKIRKMLRQQLLERRPGSVSMNQGELARFFGVSLKK